MTYYFNEDGEPLMDGAAMRYEMYLDSMYEPEYDDRDDYYDEPECDEDHECQNCSGPGGIWTQTDEGIVFVPHEGAHWRCSWCDRPCPEGSHE